MTLMEQIVAVRAFGKLDDTKDNNQAGRLSGEARPKYSQR